MPIPKSREDRRTLYIAAMLIGHAPWHMAATDIVSFAETLVDEQEAVWRGDKRKTT